MVPEGWLIKTIGEVADVKGGKRIPKGHQLTDENTGYPYIRVTDMIDGGVDMTSIKYVPADVAPKIARYRISKEDIFITVAGTLGLVGEVPVELDGANLTENADKLTNIKCNKRFLLEVLRSPIIQKPIDEEKTQNAQPKLALRRIKEFAIPYPPLPEQKKIAQILSTWDKAIATTEHLLANSQQQKKALMQQLLTGNKRLLDKNGVRFSGEWKRVELGDLLDYQQPTPYLVESTEYSDDFSTPVLTAGKTFILGYTDEELGIFSEKLPAIIFDDFTTASKFVDFPFKAKSSAMKILTAKKGVSIKYAYEAMQLLDFAVGGHQRHWISIYSRLVIPFPGKEEQQKIAAVLSTADQEITALQQKLDALKQEKKALMQQLLTGKRRVPLN